MLFVVIKEYSICFGSAFWNVLVEFYNRLCNLREKVLWKEALFSFDIQKGKEGEEQNDDDDHNDDHCFRVR